MIINLAESLIEFAQNHNINLEEVEYVGYHCALNNEQCHCTLVDFMDVAEDINFEDYDPLIKYREPIKNRIDIVSENWFIRNSNEPGAIWSYHELAAPPGHYEPISDEDIIEEIDNIDEWANELLSKESPNLDYVKDLIDINGVRYKIDGIDGLEKVVDDNGRVAVIMACNPNGRYWTTTATNKDPQILYHPELVKIVLEYRAANEIKGYPLKDCNIKTVFNIAELADKYNLDFGDITNESFNNLRVAWLPKNYEYIIEFSGAGSHLDLRHEIVKSLAGLDVIKL